SLRRLAQPTHCLASSLGSAVQTSRGRGACRLSDLTEIQRSALLEGAAISLSKIVLDFTSCAPGASLPAWRTTNANTKLQQCLRRSGERKAASGRAGTNRALNPSYRFCAARPHSRRA